MNETMALQGYSCSQGEPQRMQKLVSEDLGMRTFKRSKVHYLNDFIRAKRLKECKGRFKRVGTGDLGRILFTDERTFTVEEATNKQTKTTGLCQRTSRAL